MNQRYLTLGLVLLLIASAVTIGISANADEEPVRALPVLSNGGVTPVSGDPTGNFTFYVTYTDSDNDPPGGQSIILVLDSEMEHYLNTTVITYTTGVNFSKTVTEFESGSHEFFFYCYTYEWNTTVRYPATGSLSFTVTGDYNTPKLMNISNDPYQAGVGQDVNISAIYKDAGDHAPKYVQLSVSSGPWTNMTVIGDDYEDGVLCFAIFTANSSGYHNYRIRTEDSTNITHTSRYHSFRVQNADPVLYDGGVTPFSGEADKTNFTFWVNYKDWEGDQPYYIGLELREKRDTGYSNYTSQTYYIYSNSSYNRTELKAGVNFTKELQLLTGEYEFYFFTYGDNWIQYPDDPPYFKLTTTGWRHRPILYSASINATEGTEDSIFNISIYYKDEDNNPPLFVNVSFENSEFTLIPHGNDHRNGTLCSIETKLPFGYDELYFYSMDTQNLWANGNYSTDRIRVKGTGELGFLDAAYVTPNPGDASDWERYYFYVDYVHPVDYNRSMDAREVRLIIGNDSYWMGLYDHKDEKTYSYRERIYDLEAGTYYWHIEGLDYGFRDMRYPETGYMTLTVYERLPDIFHSNVTPMSGDDLEEYTFSMLMWEDYYSGNSSESVDAYVVIDGTQYSMSEVAAPSNWSDERIFQYETRLTPGDHEYYFKASYEDHDGYARYPNDPLTFTISVSGHSLLGGRSMLPLSPTTDDEVNITMVYQDTGGEEPLYVRVFVDNEVYNMTPGQGELKRGRTYYFTTKLTEGNHSYWFEAYGRNTTLRSPGVGQYYKVYVSKPDIVVPPILMSGTYSPSTGDNSTTFTFKVTYKHTKGYSPSFVKINIDGTEYSMSTTEGDNDVEEGRNYTYSTTLTSGDHIYYFTTEDTQELTTRAPITGTFQMTVNQPAGSVKFPPIAVISHSISGMVLSLNGSGSYDLDGSVVFYYWVVGGNSYTGASQTITFSSVGYYSATLSVTDDDGSTSSSKVQFWIRGSSSSGENENEVGGYIEVSSGGEGRTISSESGTTITLESVDDEGVSFDFSSNSSDPKVVILDISTSAVDVSSMDDLGVELDGSTITEADSLDDIINGNGTTPLYYIVRHGDSYKVMLYLPDPSDIENIDIVVDDSSSSSDPEGEDENGSWFLWVMIALSVILAIVVIVLVVSRRGPSYDGLEEYEDDEDDEPDFDMISESKRNTYRMLLEE